MDKKLNIERALRTGQLAVCGAVIGLYSVKGFDLAGLADVPLRAETFGALAGAAAITLLSFLRRA